MRAFVVNFFSNVLLAMLGFWCVETAVPALGSLSILQAVLLVVGIRLLLPSK